MHSELRVLRLSKAQLDLIAELDAAQRKASVDSLTRVWNRGAICAILNRELSHSIRNGYPLGILMLDIDRFKSINDNHGHPKGDWVLKSVTSQIRMLLRPYDGLGRYGGDEFIIVLLESSKTLAMETAERIRTEIARDPIDCSDVDIPVTVSIGVTIAETSFNTNAEDLIDQADRALYKAKNGGRNRVDAF